VPAAAVIPAPRAYTNIAAVKTLVVCHWVQVCWVAGALGMWIGRLPASGQSPVRWNTTPGSMSCTRPNNGENLPLPEVSFSGDQSGHAPSACEDN